MADIERLETLSFELGVLFAASMIVDIHDLPVVASSVIKAADLENADCAQCDDMDKVNLREVNKERGINLKGLGVAR